MPEVRRRSPLERALAEAGPGAGSREEVGVVIAERRELALVQVIARRGRERAVAERLGLDPTPGLASAVRDGTALWLAPGTWLMVAERTGGDALCRSLRERLDDLAAIADQSHGRVVLRLFGARARDVLAKGCRLDLHPRAFAPGGCAQTIVAQIGVLLHQVDERPTYDLYVASSYALDFLEWLTASAAEFGYRTDVA